MWVSIETLPFARQHIRSSDLMAECLLSASGEVTDEMYSSNLNSYMYLIFSWQSSECVYKPAKI